MILDLWVEFFDDLVNVRGRSQNTVMAYRRDLEIYVDYKTEKGASAGILGFYAFMKHKKLSLRSQARVISSLRTYFKYCETHGRSSPELRELRPPKVKVGLPKPITHEEFLKLLQASITENPLRSLRNHLCLLLLYGSGCRVSELISLNLEDFYPTESYIKVIGKGGKERLIPVSQNITSLIQKYIDEARGAMCKVAERSLLINDRGNRPSRVDVWRWLAAWSAKAGFADTIHPHQFRHACATVLLEAGADLRSIQSILGHASLQTTQIYTSVSQNKMRETVEEHHPLADIQVTYNK